MGASRAVQTEKSGGRFYRIRCNNIVRRYILVLFLPMGLHNDGVEVLDACLHLCGHGVAGPQRYHVHNLALGHSLDTWTRKKIEQ